MKKMEDQDRPNALEIALQIQQMKKPIMVLHVHDMETMKTLSFCSRGVDPFKTIGQITMVSGCLFAITEGRDGMKVADDEFMKTCDKAKEEVNQEQNRN